MSLGRRERPPQEGAGAGRRYSSQQGIVSSQQAPPSQQSAAWAAAPKANSRTRVERSVRSMVFSVEIGKAWTTETDQRGGGSAGTGSTPVVSVATRTDQAAVTTRWLGGHALPVGTPIWQPGQATPPPMAGCSSQHEHGTPSACTGVTVVTTTAGSATQRPAATKARVAKNRVK